MSYKDDLDKNLIKANGLLSGLCLKNLDTLTDYNINFKLLSDESKFYIGICNQLLKLGYEVVDEVGFTSVVENFGLKDTYEKYGGWQTVKNLKSIVDERNADSICDTFNKWNLVKLYNEKGILDLEKHYKKVEKMNSCQVADYIEYQINDIDININTDLVVENLNFTDQEIQDILDGVDMGIQFGKHSPILNNLMLGLPLSDMTMFASYSGGGKSSYIMNNIAIPVAEQGIKVCIVSNEMKAKAYKLLLQTYVLTERLDYWKLTRKKFKAGQWTDEDKQMVEKARKIIKEEYAPYISFVKMYDYDMAKVSRIAKKEAKRGMKLLVYDTMKYSGDGDNTWMSLIEDSKQLFQITSKLDIATVVSFQLSPATKNKIRILDETCLANAKQVKEVFSEMVGFRDLWSDEWAGEDCDIKPYKLVKGEDGKYKQEPIILDKTKHYKIFFHFKSRNDQVGTALVYENQGYQNKWKEIGYCCPKDKNRW